MSTILKYTIVTITFLASTLSALAADGLQVQSIANVPDGSKTVTLAARHPANGKVYTVWRSTDLKTWERVAPGHAAFLSVVADQIDPNAFTYSMRATGAAEFYRLDAFLAKFNFVRNLDVGMSGEDVAELQTYLQEKGFLYVPLGVAKGYFGAVTKSAVAAYQNAYGIVPYMGNYGYFDAVTRLHVTSMLKYGTFPPP